MRFVFLYSMGETKGSLGDHIRYLKKLAEEKVNLMSGSFENTSRGMALIEVENEEEAKSIASQDPGVKAGLLKVEVLKPKVMFDNIKI
ncbi:MAG: hypothetical protein GY870_15470 [archaeon]|nr:hypothetical protein [archaeon]